MAPLAPYTPEKVRREATRVPYARQARSRCSAARTSCRKSSRPRHLAIQINQALHDLFCKYPETLLFGEDVAQKGGVYTVTKGLHKAFSQPRVFNTLLDETIILGLAQGYANMGMLPMPEIQYLAYFHNACDQIRGEACQPAVLLEQPVPQSDGGAHRVPGLPARLRRAFPQRQLDHRAARHPRPGGGCPRAATTRR
jgi:2-oxoisovalerate dehydrogenase E1 component